MLRTALARVVVSLVAGTLGLVSSTADAQAVDADAMATLCSVARTITPDSLARGLGCSPNPAPLRSSLRACRVARVGVSREGARRSVTEMTWTDDGRPLTVVRDGNTEHFDYEAPHGLVRTRRGEHGLLLEYDGDDIVVRHVRTILGPERYVFANGRLERLEIGGLVTTLSWRGDRVVGSRQTGSSLGDLVQRVSWGRGGRPRQWQTMREGTTTLSMRFQWDAQGRIARIDTHSVDDRDGEYGFYEVDYDCAQPLGPVRLRDGTVYYCEGRRDCPFGQACIRERGERVTYCARPPEGDFYDIVR
ncbi:MAG: hypothetical protein JJ863_09665 [Deltaproteobacteria bacterium]|nr:hypothetical protein [Deltaproteobacteria bacterium]